jgi:hypothetical protein
MPIKPRQYVVVEGFGQDHNLGVFNNSVDSVCRALTERYYFVQDKLSGLFVLPAQPLSGAFQTTALSSFRQLVTSRVSRIPRLSRQQVVDRYSGPKKIAYMEAKLSLERLPLTQEDASLSMFVKYEKQDLGKAPRGINPRSTRYNLELGRYLKHAEKKIFHAINKTFASVTSATVIKGYDCVDSATVLKAKWDRFETPVAIGLDAEKFDAHVSVSALEYEHSFYTALFPGNKELDKLLQWQLVNRGCARTSDGDVKFEIRGTRASGDLNTSLGNCIIMCALIYEYAAYCGVVIELANNGDDCVVFMENNQRKLFTNGLREWFLCKGFSMKCETPVTEFEELEFCQTHPVQLDEWRMVRNHTAVLRKDAMCLIPIQNQQVYDKWMSAVGDCGLSICANCPVQNAFYQSFRQRYTKYTEGLRSQVFRGTSRLYQARETSNISNDVSALSRVSYYYAFGVLPDEQVQMENYFRAMIINPVDMLPVSREAVLLEPGLKLLNTTHNG